MELLDELRKYLSTVSKAQHSIFRTLERIDVCMSKLSLYFQEAEPDTLSIPEETANQAGEEANASHKYD